MRTIEDLRSLVKLLVQYVIKLEEAKEVINMGKRGAIGFDNAADCYLEDAARIGRMLKYRTCEGIEEAEDHS